MRPRTAYFFKDLVPDVIPAYRTYVKMFHIEPRLRLVSMEESVAEMTSGEVTHGVIFSGSAEGNLKVRDACRQFPDQYIGMAGIDITRGVTRGMKDLEQAYDEFGLAGLSLSPFMTGIPADDPRYFPLYALSEKAGKVVQIHSAVHFNPDYPLDVADPAHIDRIAVNFPGLRIVMCHAGFGFGNAGLAVVSRHPNLFADFSGLHPKALPPEMVQAINGPLKDKAIFGTNYPCLTFDIVSEWREVVREKNQPAFFHLNAERALGI
ncbi:MAG: amidohydrolase [Deltaproteobacteria bacterium]|nr:amidohydrolase [Deltaproteobacteria bacterium]